MLDRMLTIFDIEPDFDLNITKPGQTLEKTTTAATEKIGPVIDQVELDIVPVHGDATRCRTRQITTSERSPTTSTRRWSVCSWSSSPAHSASSTSR